MRHKGNSSILIIIIVLVLVIVGASAASYYFLQSQGKMPTYSTSGSEYTPNSVANYQSTSTNSVSYSDEVETLEEELNETSAGDIDGDIQDLNSSASSL